jgi:hypothetical protein
MHHFVPANMGKLRWFTFFLDVRERNVFPLYGLKKEME